MLSSFRAWLPSLAVTGIPVVPGLYIAFFQDYLLICSYVLCAEIYFSTTSQPTPTEIHGSNLEPGNGHRTIPSNGEIPSRALCYFYL